MSTCQIPGCHSRGHHVDPLPAGHDDECKGCAPRETFEPWLTCRSHGVRFADTLDELPRFLAHLREIGKPFAQAAPLGAEAHETPEGFANLPEAIMAAGEIESEVLWIVRGMIDDAPEVLGRRLSYPERRPWKGDRLAWLIDHADDALRFPGVMEPIASLLSEVETARHRWPTVDDLRPALKLDLPCPRCGLRSLVRRPVVWERQTERIDCTDPECARIFTREEYERFAEIALREGKMGKWRTEESA